MFWPNQWPSSECTGKQLLNAQFIQIGRVGTITQTLIVIYMGQNFIVIEMTSDIIRHHES